MNFTVEERKVIRFIDEDNVYYVDVEENKEENTIDFYLGRNGYGEKSLMFGLMAEDMDFSDRDAIQAMIEDNIDDYIEDYEDDFVDYDDYTRDHFEDDDDESYDYDDSDED